MLVPVLCFKITAQYVVEGTMDSTADLLSDPDLWQNESFLFNTTAANASSDYIPLMSPAISKAINITLIIALTITMVSLGCTMELSKIKVTSGDIHLFKAHCIYQGYRRSLPPY